MFKIFEALHQLHLRQEPHVVATLVQKRGSAPQILGAKIIVTQKGLHAGTIGGGKLEAYCLRKCGQMLETTCEAYLDAHLETINLQRDIKMSCGGEVDIFFEPASFSQWQIAIFGAGHISQELCRVMLSWQCQVSVFDTRAEWLEKLVSAPHINKYMSADLAAEIPQLRAQTYLLVMTQGHQTDVPILAAALSAPEKFAFIGVIGSAVKAQKLKRELAEKGISTEALDRLHCPLGMPFGNDTPAEISISIAAQILSMRDSLAALS